MAIGLSIPPLAPQAGRASDLFQQFFQGFDRSPSSVPTNSTANPASGDVLDLGSSFSEPERAPAPGQIALDPNGIYRFASQSFLADFDLSFSQTTVEATSEAEGASARAAFQEFNLSIRVSAEFEQALIETGRARGGNPVADFRSASESALNRLAAERLSASISINLSFSQASIGIGTQGGGGIQTDPLADLGAFASDGTLGGFITLLEAFFGDDERFEKFLSNLRKVVQDFSSTSTSTAAPATAEEVPPPPTAGQTLSTQSTRLDVSINLSFESTTVEVTSGGEAEAKDPIVLDLDGDGIELTTAASGVQFDLDADGSLERMATVTGGDGFLALDRNGNGTIDHGKELFGDQNGAANGFAELRRYDLNRDSVIDAKDEIYSQLRIFVDSNRDGVSQRAELGGLREMGISSISLADREVSESAAGGNRIAQRSTYTRIDGTKLAAADVLLNRIV